MTVWVVMGCRHYYCWRSSVLWWQCVTWGCHCYNKARHDATLLWAGSLLSALQVGIDGESLVSVWWRVKTCKGLACTLVRLLGYWVHIWVLAFCAEGLVHTWLQDRLHEQAVAIVWCCGCEGDTVMSQADEVGVKVVAVQQCAKAPRLRCYQSSNNKQSSWLYNLPAATTLLLHSLQQPVRHTATLSVQFSCGVCWPNKA